MSPYFSSLINKAIHFMNNFGCKRCSPACATATNCLLNQMLLNG